METLDKILNAVQNQTDERMYDLVWVGKNYSKTDLIKDLRNLYEEIELEKEIWTYSVME